LTFLFQNLIWNAVTYRQSGIPPQVHISAQRDDLGWRFSVADNGIGVDARHFESIFVPLRRLNKGANPWVGAIVAGARFRLRVGLLREPDKGLAE